MSNPAPYTPAWRSYRRGRLAFWVLFLGFVPTVVNFAHALSGTGLGALVGVLTAAWMVDAAAP